VIFVIVAMEQVGVRLLKTLMQEIHPAEIPMKTTALQQSTTITGHMPLQTHMKTWYGSQMYQTFKFQEEIGKRL